jgi:hypothetical protein
MRRITVAIQRIMAVMILLVVVEAAVGDTLIKDVGTHRHFDGR